MLFKLISILLVLFCVKSLAQEEVQANWTPCPSTTFRRPQSIKSENVKIYITNCISNQTCQLVRGQSPNLTIEFTPTENSSAIERLLIASIFMPRLNKNVIIPYGPIVNPCSQMTDNLGNTDCLSTGIVKNRIYKHFSQFKVMPSFPQVSGINVTAIIRKTVQASRRNRGNSNARLYASHPGPVFICAVIPVDVV